MTTPLNRSRSSEHLPSSQDAAKIQSSQQNADEASTLNKHPEAEETSCCAFFTSVFKSICSAFEEIFNWLRDCCCPAPADEDKPVDPFKNTRTTVKTALTDTVDPFKNARTTVKTALTDTFDKIDANFMKTAQNHAWIAFKTGTPFLIPPFGYAPSNTASQTTEEQKAPDSPDHAWSLFDTESLSHARLITSTLRNPELRTQIEKDLLQYFDQFLNETSEECHLKKFSVSAMLLAVFPNDFNLKARTYTFHLLENGNFHINSSTTNFGFHYNTPDEIDAIHTKLQQVIGGNLSKEEILDKFPK